MNSKHRFSRSYRAALRPSAATYEMEEVWRNEEIWDKFFVELEKLRIKANASDKEDFPNETSIRNSRRFLIDIRPHSPLPPSCIVQDPAGGLIIEFETPEVNIVAYIGNDNTYQLDSVKKGKIVDTVDGSFEDSDELPCGSGYSHTYFERPSLLEYGYY